MNFQYFRRLFSFVLFARHLFSGGSSAAYVTGRATHVVLTQSCRVRILGPDASFVILEIYIFFRKFRTLSFVRVQNVLGRNILFKIFDGAKRLEKRLRVTVDGQSLRRSIVLLSKNPSQNARHAKISCLVFWLKFVALNAYLLLLLAAY